MDRPQRWDVPFDEKMTKELVNEILLSPAFKNIDQDKFPKNLPLQDIILNDTRIITKEEGEIIVKEGDYGNSAFLILDGSVKVVLGIEQNEKLMQNLYGKEKQQKLGLFRSIAQLWKNNPIAEHRQKVSARNKDGELFQPTSEDDFPRVFLQDIPGVISDGDTVEIESGEFFGEIAALGRTPRSASIYASSKVTRLLEIKWQGLRDIRKYTKEIREHIDRLYRERSLDNHLKNSPYFSHLSEEQLKIVSDATIFRSFGEFDWHTSYQKLAKKELNAGNRLDHEPLIVEEDSVADDLIMIRAGFARISERTGSGHRTNSYLGKGRVFGIREIYHGWKNDEEVSYQNSLRAIGHTDILVVPSYIVETVILPNLPSHLIPDPINSKSGNNSDEDIKKLKDRDKEVRLRTDAIEFFVENRFINGKESMLIDLNRCTRCDDCVVACSVAHDGNPRFERHGKSLGSLMVAHACMHCQDPICMIGCPTGAISMAGGDQGEVVINDLTCIGCTTCANSCPYENIKMVQVRDDKAEFVVDSKMKPIVKATKCDLCFQQIGGPSCQTACPHDALVRMDMNDTPKIAKWLKR